MKHLAIAALALSFGLASSVCAREVSELPGSLGQWYKPQNERQVWLHTMFSLRREMQAVEGYADSGDVERLRGWVSRFGKHYRSIAEMVPEWADEVDLTALERLEALAGAGDVGVVGSALKDLRQTCRSCHREFRALAAARYRGPDFSSVRVGTRPYGEAMEALSVTLNRVQIASTDGLWEQAREASSALRGGLSELAETCGGCHEETAPRERILGAATQASLAELDRAIEAQDPKAAGRVLGAVAVQSCARCHGTHRILYDLQHQLVP